MKLRTRKLNADLDGEKIEFYQVSIERKNDEVILCASDDPNIAELVHEAVKFYIEFFYGWSNEAEGQDFSEKISWLQDEETDYTVTGFLRLKA